MKHAIEGERFCVWDSGSKETLIWTVLFIQGFIRREINTIDRQKAACRVSEERSSLNSIVGVTCRFQRKEASLRLKFYFFNIWLAVIRDNQ